MGLNLRMSFLARSKIKIHSHYDTSVMLRCIVVWCSPNIDYFLPKLNTTKCTPNQKLKKKDFCNMAMQSRHNHFTVSAVLQCKKMQYFMNWHHCQLEI